MLSPDGEVEAIACLSARADDVCSVAGSPFHAGEDATGSCAVSASQTIGTTSAALLHAPANDDKLSSR